MGVSNQRRILLQAVAVEGLQDFLEL